MTDCGDCPSGYYCPEQSVEPMPCPKGYYCPVNQEFPLPCPIGTFGAGEKLTDVGDCTTCYGGRFCSQYGLVAPDGECDPGFYCVDKSMTPVPKTLHVGDVGNVCEAGGYCPIATKYPLPCRPGFYQPSTSKVAYSDCIECECGMYCDGRPDTDRTDIVADLIYLIDKLPSASMSGPCDDGYWCGTQSSHPKQNVALQGQFTKITPAAGAVPAKGACGPSLCQPGTFQFEQG